MTEVQLNSLLSRIAHDHGNDLRRLCKETNTFFPPPWYKSVRGIRMAEKHVKHIKETNELINNDS